MTRHTHTPWMPLGVVAVFALAAAPAGAQPSTSEARIQALVRLAAQQIANGQPPGTPNTPPASTAHPLPVDDRPTVSLTLDDVVALALERNLNIAVQRLYPSQFDPALASLRAAYWPQATSLLGTQSQASPPIAGTIGIPPGATAVTQGITTFNGGLLQNLPWWGGQLAATLNNIKSTSTSTSTLYNPVYLPTYTVAFTQPLLRGRAIDPNRQQILVTKIARDISDVQLKSTIVNTLANVREAYWSYVYTMQAVEVAQQALESASQLTRDNQVRVQVGTIPLSDVVTAQSQEAQARLGVIQATGIRDSAELALKQQIVADTHDANWNARLVPTDRLEFAPVDVNVDDAIRRALAERTDLVQAKKGLQQNDITYRFLRNQLLPQADLVASYSLAGLGGTQLLRESNNAISSQIVSTLPGGYGNALTSLFANDYPAWSVQVRVSAPIGSVNVGAASLAAAKIEMDQAAAQMQQIELQIATDVTNAALRITNNVQAVQAAQVAEDLAQQSYDSEITKLDVGVSNNNNVIQQLNALNATKNNYLQAVLSYQTALVELDRLQQTTLNTANVTLLSGAAWGNGAQAIGNLTGAPVGSAR
jgi:outer membrane protein